MLEFVILSLAAALVLYAVLGGADFGSGIWEIFIRSDRRAQEDLIATALAPVWEANHVWLIIALVISFTAFPAIFQAVSVTFHIPLLLALVGITLRGCAFTFRHYDSLQTARERRLYTVAFEAGSVLTPLVLGMVVGGLGFGPLPPPSSDFVAAFVAPWLNAPAAAVGVFTLTVFAYTAAVFLVAETNDLQLRERWRRRVKISAMLAVVSGASVFVVSQWSAVPLTAAFLTHPLSVCSLVVATVLFWPIWQLLRSPQPHWARFLVATQTGLVLTGWGLQRYPVILQRQGEGPLTFAGAAAPAATLTQLVYALVIGGVMMLPSLAWLLFVYKKPVVPPAARRVVSA